MHSVLVNVFVFIQSKRRLVVLNLELHYLSPQNDVKVENYRSDESVDKPNVSYIVNDTTKYRLHVQISVAGVHRILKVI